MTVADGAGASSVVGGRRWSLVLVTVVAKGVGRSSSGELPDWFTKDIHARAAARRARGMKAAIVGTMHHHRRRPPLIAVPLGIAGAIYLNEYGRGRPFATRAAVPGQRDDRRAVDRDGPVHLRRSGCVPLGHRRAQRLRGALALACLMLPIVVRSTEEMLRLVPENLREASYALGAQHAAARRSRSCCRTALPGILSGCLLAVARAAGETAPLLFTIGAAKRDQLEPRSAGTNTVAVDADLRQRQGRAFATRPGAGVGRGAHADRPGVRCSRSLRPAARRHGSPRTR